MKILQINTVCGNGSVGRITVDIYHALVQEGSQGLIAYGRRNAPQGIHTYAFGTKMDMGIHVLHTFLKGEHGFASKGQTKKLIAKIREYDPDVIHLHNIHGFYLNVELLFEYLKTAGKPVVWTLHDCWSFTGHCAYFDYAGCSKWKTACGKCPQYRSAYPYALLKDNSAENYARKRKAFTGVPDLTIVTPSKWLADLVKQSFLKEYPVRVIHNGISLEHFKPAAGSLRDRLGLQDKYVILGVANMWETRKGYPYFEQLAAELGKDYQVILIGLDKKKLKKLPGNILGLARTDSVQELAEYYAMADVYVNATLEDNFPTTNLEALACGTPVITFATGGSVESINGKCGKIVPKGDAKMLKEAILDTQKHPFSEEACLEQAGKYDKYERFHEYLELYKSVTEESL